MISLTRKIDRSSERLPWRCEACEQEFDFGVYFELLDKDPVWLCAGCLTGLDDVLAGKLERSNAALRGVITRLKKKGE